DEDGHAEVRRRLPWMTLAAGEHFYTPFPYQRMLERGCLDILQPDIHWVGGLTACVKIAHMAEAAGKQVCLHGGGRDRYGQHFTWAMPNTPWGEFYIGSDPGVPLEEAADGSTSSGRAAGAGEPVDSWLLSQCCGWLAGCLWTAGSMSRQKAPDLTSVSRRTGSSPSYFDRPWRQPSALAQSHILLCQHLFLPGDSLRYDPLPVGGNLEFE
ncbi:MAG TPA: hypothetical protein EYQ31_14500, partial [Candidatus Handelsmanbacteria bacterium]|nr:hypothetical protein [Candidatus Handelsmanbacteria bacterium]